MKDEAWERLGADWRERHEELRRLCRISMESEPKKVSQLAEEAGVYIERVREVLKDNPEFRVIRRRRKRFEGDLWTCELTRANPN